MRPAEEGLLLLCCALGTQDVPLTPAQYRTLARRVRQTCQAGDGEVTPAYLRALGYPEAAAVHASIPMPNLLFSGSKSGPVPK